MGYEILIMDSLLIVLIIVTKTALLKKWGHFFTLLQKRAIVTRLSGINSFRSRDCASYLCLYYGFYLSALKSEFLFVSGL